jgi:CBS domain-containing protein
MTLVQDIMETDFVTVHPEDKIEDVLRLLRRHDLPGVPVVDHSDRCVGIITDSDLVIGDEQGDLHLPHYIELFGGVIYLEPLRRFEERIHKAFASKVRDMMTADPVTIAGDATVEQAAHVIATKKHNRLPVIEDGKLVGVVTRLDVLEALHGEQPAA